MTAFVSMGLKRPLSQLPPDAGSVLFNPLAGKSHCDYTNFNNLLLYKVVQFAENKILQSWFVFVMPLTRFQDFSWNTALPFKKAYILGVPGYLALQGKEAQFELKALEKKKSPLVKL